MAHTRFNCNFLKMEIFELQNLSSSTFCELETRHLVDLRIELIDNLSTTVQLQL